MEICLVFTPDTPNLYSLNPTAWLILELCDGRQLEELEDAYYDAVEPLVSREEARREVRSGIDGLVRKGIVELIGNGGSGGNVNGRAT
jgi:hypothetical protein